MIKKILLLAVVAISFVACDVTKTQEGKLPEVNVEGGQMPKYDVDGPDVDVSMKEKTIKVPTVQMEEKVINVPDVDVDMPDMDIPDVDVETTTKKVEVPTGVSVD